MLSYDRKTSNPVFHYSKHGGPPYGKILEEDPDSLKSIQVDVNKNMDVNSLFKVA